MTQRAIYSKYGGDPLRFILEHPIKSGVQTVIEFHAKEAVLEYNTDVREVNLLDFTFLCMVQDVFDQARVEAIFRAHQPLHKTYTKHPQGRERLKYRMSGGTEKWEWKYIRSDTKMILERWPQWQAADPPPTYGERCAEVEEKCRIKIGIDGFSRKCHRLGLHIRPKVEPPK